MSPEMEEYLRATRRRFGPSMLEIGALSIVLPQLQRRVGEVKPSTIARLNVLILEDLELLGVALLDFTSTKDLNRWLREHAPTRRKIKRFSFDI